MSKKWMVVRVNVFIKGNSELLSEPMFELDMQGPYNQIETADEIRDSMEWEEQTDEAQWFVIEIEQRS